MMKILLIIGQLLKEILKKKGSSTNPLPQEKDSTSISRPLTQEIKENIKIENVQKVIHKREKESEDTILGTWYLDGKEICKTLENGWKGNKNKISCIPTGTYTCKRDYTGRFQYWQVLNVPHRSNIEIHNGNINDHTLGCIIIGARWGRYKDKPAVLNSKPTLEKLKTILDHEFELEVLNG